MTTVCSDQEADKKPDRVVGPDGKILTLEDLPPPETKRWVARRKAEVVAADVTDDAQVKAMAEHARNVFDGRIDILVNVAGVTGPIETPAWEIDAEDFSHVIEANIRGTFLPIKYVIPTMVARRSGNIVNIGGTSGLRGYKYRAAYS